ncbi:MAG: hypothetical protein L3K26_08020, partial [Candidatus Hydrogenedentes bacterium]|nr:hypothetical protein [Candidatus Hydrogenedentota bacterium]
MKLPLPAMTHRLLWVSIVTSLIILITPVARCGDIIMITHGPPDLILPSETTDNLPAYYGIGLPLQVSATEAALFCNLRVIAPGMFDYEDGTDVLVFESLKALRSAKPTPISRNLKLPPDEAGKEHLVVKFPVAGGFWPIGAKAVDGSLHPGEGRGFGLCQALSVETDEKGLFTWVKPFERFVETMQLSYDGTKFQVTKRALVGPSPLPPASLDGWKLISPGLSNAIPQGDNLLLPVLARRKNESHCGVSRWQWKDGEWGAAEFMPVSAGSEPSLVRVTDASLLFTTRLGGKRANTIVVWRSADAGKTWQEIVRQDNVRSAAPVSINRSACGTPFIATSPSGEKRPRLDFWMIQDGQLSDARLIRDCPEEFGPAPKEAFWNADHPSSAVLRLADGQWHALMTYRIKMYYLPTRGRPEPV